MKVLHYFEILGYDKLAGTWVNDFEDLNLQVRKHT
jgi:hypothetical protein